MKQNALVAKVMEQPVLVCNYVDVIGSYCYTYVQTESVTQIEKTNCV